MMARLAVLLSLTLVVALVVVVRAGGAMSRATQPRNLEALLAAHDWLNGQPNAQTLRGKVVLVDFYTFDCINCKHVQPTLRELYRQYSRSDLAVIAVHSPETSHERSRTALLASMQQQGVAWPVAVDNNFAVWNAYGIEAWPTQLIFDRAGTLRGTIVGEGRDDEVRGLVGRLVAGS
jgi:thiol-disulfide isomerase/thioredoxin